MARRRCYWTRALGFVGFLCVGVLGQNWTGGGSSDLWSDGENWDSHSAPTAGAYASVDVPADTVCRITAGTAAACLTLRVGNDVYATFVEMEGGTLSTADAYIGVDNLYGRGHFNMSGGDWSSGSSVHIGWNGTGSLTLTDGTVHVGATVFVPGLSGSGFVGLYGGSLTCADVVIGPADTSFNRGLLDVAGGELVVAGDKRSKIADYVARRLIIGEGGTRRVEVEYDVGANTTTVRASGEYAPAMGGAGIRVWRVAGMPNQPSPYLMRDWPKVARDYVDFYFDESKTGDYLPLVTWPDGPTGMFNVPSYVGCCGVEAINAMAAVVSGSLVGYDMRTFQGHNWASKCLKYFFCASEGVAGNNVPACGTCSFWYKLLPNILYFQIIHQYPDMMIDGETAAERLVTIADSWRDVTAALGGGVGPTGVPDFNYTEFNFSTMEGQTNGLWIEPGASGAVAWLEYMAYIQEGEARHLEAAKWALDFLEARGPAGNSPLYEIISRYGPVTAARMNAEQGTSYDVDKLMNWLVNVSPTRYGWGVIEDGPWGGYDCDGLAGSTTDTGGYAFTMNTFQSAATAVPVVRYDQSVARDVGKWMLNLANAARLLYPNGLPAENQTNRDWADTNDPDYCIAYEGMRKEAGGKSPYATGDLHVPTNLGLYGSSHVGYMSIFKTTNIDKILQIDCLLTDWFRNPAYPTYLYFNPYDVEQSVAIDVGAGLVDLYDSVSQTFKRRGVSGPAVSFDIPADSAVVLVVAPADGTIRQRGRKMLINGVVVDYHYNKTEAVEIRFDEASSAALESSAVLSWDHTVGQGVNRFLVVGLAAEHSTASMGITAVTYGGEAMLPVAGASKTAGTGWRIKTDMYYLPAPAVGTATITVTYEGVMSRLSGGAVSLFNVKQGAAESVATASTPGAASIAAEIATVSEGAWVVDVVGSGNDGTFAGGMYQDTRWSAVSGTSSGACSTSATGLAGPVTVAWTHDNPSRMALSAAAFGRADYARGDFEPDGDVDLADFSYLASRWLDSCAGESWCDGVDLDESTQVDMSDMSEFLLNWQP